MEFHDKGYLYTSIQMPQSALFCQQVYNLQNGLMPENTETYLRTIIEYCQENHINIVLFISPIYATQVLSAIEYDLYDQQISTIANEYGIPFYDFNLCRSEYFDIMHKEYFMDIDHLNNTGVNIYMQFLWEVLKNDPGENQKYFCESYEEKISLDAPETYGVYYYYEEDVRKVTIASNRKTEMEYQVAIMPDGGEERVIQEFSTNKDFVLPGEEHGTLTIVSRMKTQPEQLRAIEMEY